MTALLSGLVAAVTTAKAVVTSDAVAAQTLPAIAEHDGVHAATGAPLLLVAIAAGFVLAGTWMLVISSRPRG